MVLCLGARQPELEHRQPHAEIRRRHFQRNTAVQTGANAGFERFQFGRRPVCRNDDLLGAVQQHVDQMAELMLDRLALQELHVVDDQQVDIPQLLLQRQTRCCRGWPSQSAT